jgi:hypothetical protein
MKSRQFINWFALVILGCFPSFPTIAADVSDDGEYYDICEATYHSAKIWNVAYGDGFDLPLQNRPLPWTGGWNITCAGAAWVGNAGGTQGPIIFDSPPGVVWRIGGTSLSSYPTGKFGYVLIDATFARYRPDETLEIEKENYGYLIFWAKGNWLFGDSAAEQLVAEYNRECEGNVGWDAELSTSGRYVRIRGHGGKARSEFVAGSRN